MALKVSNLRLYQQAKIYSDRQVKQIGTIGKEPIWQIGTIGSEKLVCVGADPRKSKSEAYELYELYNGQVAPILNRD